MSSPPGSSRDPELPPDLANRLRAIIPASAPNLAARERIVALARSHHTARRRRHRFLLSTGAAAAALALLAGGAIALWPSAPPRVQVAQQDPMDLNRDGVIDMLDALAARLTLDRAGTVAVSGALGQAAIDSIAQRAVRLPLAPEQPA